MFLEEDHDDQRSRHAPQSKGKQEQVKCGGEGESKVGEIESEIQGG